jgi:polysaccharide biosynthesis/export protein
MKNHEFLRSFIISILFGLCVIACQSASAAGTETADYRLGSGDAIRISVFQSPDLLLETRVSESGTISYPLIGTVDLDGLSVSAAEKKIAKLLNDGGFVIDPQVTVVVLTIRSNQVSVLGQVSRPGKYPLDQANMKVSDVLALAGGAIPGSADTVVVTGIRDGKSFNKTIDVRSMILDHKLENDIIVNSGDIVYVDRADMFYVYGEVQRPGAYRLERGMTVMQALAQGGGVTARGTERGIRIYRNDTIGKKMTIEPDMQDVVKADDVINVRERIF